MPNYDLNTLKFNYPKMDIEKYMSERNDYFKECEELNEDEEFSGDYIQELNNMLLDTVKEAKRERKMIYQKRLWVFAELLIIAFLMGL